MEYLVTKFFFAISLQVAALFFAWLASPLTLILAGMCGLGVLALRVRLRPEDLPLSYNPANQPDDHWGER